jgi:hypothetical protein
MITILLWSIFGIGIFAAVWELEMIRQILTSMRDGSSLKRPDQR